MENATKALIIAGAILVSILLISFGIILVNQNKGAQTAASNLSNSMLGASQNKANEVMQTINSISTTE